MRIHLHTPEEEERDLLPYANFLLPIFGADFGAEDSDEEDDDEEDEDEDADEVVDKLAKDADAKKNGKGKGKAAPAGSKYVPPSEGEYKRMLAALTKANTDQRTRRQAALEKAKAEGLSEGEAKARADAEEQATGRYQPRLIEYEARLALVEAGCKNPGRLVKLIDKSSVTLVENPKNGQIETIGLEDQVNALMDDWPELFGNSSDDDAPPAVKPKGKQLDAHDRRPAGSRGQKSSSELALDRLRGL